jgi:hypothetical protein
MDRPNDFQKQQHQRFTEIFNRGKQRYVQAVGNNKGYSAGIRGKDYLSDEERKEAKQILQQIFEKSSLEKPIQAATTNHNVSL